MAPLFLTLTALARRLSVHPNTIKNWAALGFITVYTSPDGQWAFSAGEVEAEIQRNPRMRDKRNPFGENARILPLPPKAQVANPKRPEIVLTLPEDQQ